MHRVAIGQAPECRTLSSVADSALSVEANSAKGGHLWIATCRKSRWDTCKQWRMQDILKGGSI